MPTFVVQLPAVERYRLGMFGRNALHVVPSPQLTSLQPDQAVVLVRSTPGTVSKIVQMFPNWQFKLLIE